MNKKLKDMSPMNSWSLERKQIRDVTISRSRFHKDNLRHHPRFPLISLAYNRFSLCLSAGSLAISLFNIWSSRCFSPKVPELIFLQFVWELPGAWLTFHEILLRIFFSRDPQILIQIVTLCLSCSTIIWKIRIWLGIKQWVPAVGLKV